MRCSRCGQDRPREEFGPAADGWPERRECRQCSRSRSQVRRHGLDSEQRAEIAARQGGCRICGHPEPGSKGWVVDHDRECCPDDKSCPKCRRGVVCQWCNSMLGYAFDRVETLTAAIAYLSGDRGCEWHMPVACAPGICGTHVQAADARTDRTDGTDGDLTPPQPQPSVSRRARAKGQR